MLSPRVFVPVLAGVLSLASVPTYAQNQAKPIVSLASLLREMTDAGTLARWPSPAYTSREASSYDRASATPDKPSWWANADFTQFIRTEENAGRKEQVMMDADGPGALVRFWLTAGSPKEGTLRVYLDGDSSPVLTFTSFDLLAGGLNLPPALLYKHESHSANAGGNTLYLPIPYAKHCKVTWEEGPRPGQRYYEIDYRTYAPGTQVETFTTSQFSAAQSLIESTSRALSTPPQAAEGKLISLNQKLLPQNVKSPRATTLNLPPGPAAVGTVELLLDAGNLAPAELERALRSVIIELRFDDERTVWCPATDFFGTAVGINELNSLYRSVGSDGTMRCRWTMPYQRNAQISLTNLGLSPVMATLHATTAPWKWDARSMYFHANWHYQKNMKSMTIDEAAKNTALRDWNFIDIKGRGVYVGDSLAIFNPVETWYGEGDEKIYVDRAVFPTHFGTGTEDYYGYSYAPRPVFQTPFANHIRIDSPSTQGYNVMNRTRPLDAIPFNSSLRFDIELISWRSTTMTYGATTYWYALPGATSNRAPQPQEATLPIQTVAGFLAEVIAARTPKSGAIDAETLKVINYRGDFTPKPQDMEVWDSSRWSRGHQLLGQANAIGDFVEIEVPAPGNAPRQIVIQPTQAPDFGTLRFAVNGQPSTATFDGYAEQVQPGAPVNLGVFTPKDGKFVLRIEVSGSNPNSKKPATYFGIDYITLSAP